MLHTDKAARLLVSAVAGAALVFSLAACSVQKEKDGSDEKVKIETPVGALNVDTQADAQETGVPVYPGAKPSQESSGEHNQANVNIASSLFGVKVVALEYVSDDAPDKVVSFYKKELAKYGEVLDCKNGVSEHGDRLSCSEVAKHNDNERELAVGTKQRQHLVSIKPKGNGTKFALVYVQVRGKEGTL